MSQAVAGTAPGRSLLPQVFELWCADVHPVCCDETLRAASLEELLACTREHGERAHGFTAVWYSAERLAAIAEAVTAR
jgi:predicted small metal-binding protein